MKGIREQEAGALGVELNVGLGACRVDKVANSFGNWAHAVAHIPTIRRTTIDELNQVILVSAKQQTIVKKAHTTARSSVSAGTSSMLGNSRSQTFSYTSSASIIFVARFSYGPSAHDRAKSSFADGEMA